jgi:hypothetical protein
MMSGIDHPEVEGKRRIVPFWVPEETDSKMREP